MLRMIFVADLFEKIRVAPDAAAIFRRAGALASDEFRIGFSFSGWKYPLDFDFVAPAIAKVVFVWEPRAFSAGHVVEPRAELVPEFVRRFIQIEGRIAVARIVDLEEVQVGMRSSHALVPCPAREPYAITARTSASHCIAAIKAELIRHRPYLGK
jgi:hypothetical protein